MSARAVEAVLARLYTDADLRAAFLRDGQRALAGADLTEAECSELAAMDRVGLQMAAASYARKQEGRRKTFWQRVVWQVRRVFFWR